MGMADVIELSTYLMLIKCSWDFYISKGVDDKKKKVGHSQGKSECELCVYGYTPLHSFFTWLLSIW